MTDRNITLRTAALLSLSAATAAAIITHGLHIFWARLTRGSKDGRGDSGSSTAHVTAGNSIFIAEQELKQVVSKCLHLSGASEENAKLVADVLVAADKRGIPSHGVNRCEMYCAELLAGLIDGNKTPQILLGTDGPSTAVVDGHNALGAVVSQFAMELCIKKAKAQGIAMITCCHSNHYGIAAYWALLAMREGLIGFSFTNTSPFMVPTRSTARSVGTNPICCCCPAGPDDSFELDMATTAVPIGKVEVLHRKGVSVPEGWGVDSNGSATTSAEEILKHGGLCPLGGGEETAGYKGYGLCMLVEVLCAVLSGNSAAGPNVPPWLASRKGPVEYGHCFICVDPNRFAPGFEQRLASYLSSLRVQPRADSSVPVLVPGDPEKAACDESCKNGVSLHPNVAASVARLAKRLGAEVPQALLMSEAESKHIEAPFVK